MVVLRRGQGDQNLSINSNAPCNGVHEFLFLLTHFIINTHRVIGLFGWILGSEGSTVRKNRRSVFVVTVLLGLLSMGLATSCTSSKQASKIQELEQRLQASERKVSELENKFNPLTTQVGEMKGILLHLANKVNAQQKPQASSRSNYQKKATSKKTTSKKSSAKKSTQKSSKKKSQTRNR